MRGIYKIENKVNNKTYIGESLDINRRWQEHIESLNSGKHHSWKLQNDWNEYGEDNFEFSIITTLKDDIPKYVDTFILIIYENNYVKQYNSISQGYNIENTLSKIENGTKENFTKKDLVVLNRYKDKVNSGEIINNNGTISFTRDKEYFSIFPNKLFYTIEEDEVSIFKECNNYKVILLLDYMYVNTNRQGVVKFTLKDVITTYGYKPNRNSDKINEQIKNILIYLKNKNIIDFKTDLTKVTINDFISCKYNGIELDEKGNMAKFTTIPLSTINKILNYENGKFKKEQLLFYFGYLCSRMYLKPKENKSSYKRQPNACHVTYDRIFYDTDISSSTIKKYNDILVELGLIKIGNLGLCYTGEKKTLKESCNFYTLVDKNDLDIEDDKNTTWYWNLKESMDIYKKKMNQEGFIFTNTREYKDNNRKLNGYISRINQLEKLGKATDEQLVKRDKLLK